MATVLIVEDKFIFLETLSKFLADKGYYVLTAADERQRLQRLARKPLTDLVISDLMMPVLDGASLLKAMQNNDVQRSIPYIVMSEIAEADVCKQITNYAAFIRKPFHINTIIQIVATILNE